MKKTSLLRNRLAISQRDFANYLGISQSLLAMVENSLRSLPLKASMKETQLEIEYLNMQKSKEQGSSGLALQPALDKQEKKIADEILYKIKHHELKAEILQRRLKELTNTQQLHKDWLHIIDKKLSGKTKESKLDQLWLEVQQSEVSQKLLKYSNTSQVKLQLETDLLRATANVYRSCLQKLSRKNSL